MPSPANRAVFLPGAEEEDESQNRIRSDSSIRNRRRRNRKRAAARASGQQGGEVSQAISAAQMASSKVEPPAAPGSNTAAASSALEVGRSAISAQAEAFIPMTNRQEHAHESLGSADWNSYTSSQTWLSPNEKEYEKYLAARTNLGRIVPRSDLVPQTFPEWLRHRLETLQAKKAEAEKRLLSIKESAGGATVMPAMGGKTFGGRRGTVLCMETIWCSWPTPPERMPAAWPSLQEMKWEGDDRARTGVSRFPPIPREAGNETVAWHQLRAAPILAFDQVRKVPTADDLALPPMEPPPSSLIDSSLWSEIDG